MSSVDITLIEHMVRVTDNPEVAAELQTVVMDRLKYRKAIGECLKIAASGRVDAALRVLRRACPEAEVEVGETAVRS